jgi:hypothetical protein
VLGMMPPLSWDRGRLLFTLGDEGSAEMEDIQCVDNGVATSVISLSVTSEAWDAQTVKGAKDFDNPDCIRDAEKKPETCLSSFNIVLWHDQVVECEQLLSLIPSPFKRGIYVIGG